MDLAASIQDVTAKKSMLRLTRSLAARPAAKNLCLAGGVALNCVGQRQGAARRPFEQIWIQPAAGDAGGALGAALAAWYHYLDNPRPPRQRCARDAMHGRYLGSAIHQTMTSRHFAGAGAQFTCSQRLEPDRAVVPRPRADREARSAGSRAGWSSGRARSAPAASSVIRARPDAVMIESQGQVSVSLPALRALGAARASRGVVRARLRLALHATGGADAVGDPSPRR